MASKSTAAKPAAKKAAPKKAEPKPAEVDVAVLTAEAGDAHAVLHLDGKQFRLRGEIVNALRRAFDAAHHIVNPGH